MMELDEFIQLSFYEKARKLLANSEFIAFVGENNNSYILFAYFDYFVEIRFSYKGVKIVEIHPIKKVEHLHKYLDSIDISSLTERLK